MAEFEELRLTVNLVDNASAGLTKIRGEIGLLTQSATGLTTAVNAASAGVTNLGNATNKTAPGVRTLNAEMREAGRYANELKDGFARMGQAAQGLQSLPAIASNVRDLGMSLHGLSTSFSRVSPMAGAAVIGIGAVAIAVVGLGAAVVAYGVSVFKFAKEMDQLGKTARQIGVSFAELKYAQDEAKKFGQSAESITRSFQAVGDAQFNLSKNNSTLRSRLIGMGVEANWVNQLAAMDPNKARNAVITYGKALERQLLEAGVAKNVARAMMNQFGAEFGLSAEDMDMPLLKDPDPKTKAELERIGELSKQIGIVWGEIGAIWDDFSTEILAMGLPIVLDALTTLQAQLPALLGELKTELKGLIEALPGFIATIPETLTSIRETMTDVANIFRDVKGLYDTITGKTSELTKDGKSADTGEKGEGALQQQDREKLERSDLAKGAGLDDIGKPPAASPPAADPFPNANRAGRLSRPALPPQQRPGGIQLQSYQGSANDNNPLLVRASFTSEELVDETGKNTTQTEKLTQQLEKLNAFFDRMEGRSTGATGGGGGGFQNAAYHPDEVGNAPGGGSSSSGGGFKSGGGYSVLDQSNGSNGSSAPSTTAAPSSANAPSSTSTTTTTTPPTAGAQPSAAAAQPGGVSKADASAIFGGGNVAGAGTMPSAMTGAAAAPAGPGAVPAAASGPPIKVDDSAGGRKAGLDALTGEIEGTGATVTSGYRSPNHPLSKANPHSAHSQGLAFDTRAKTPEQAEAAIKKIRDTMGARGLKEGRDYKILDEVRHPSPWATGPHVHTQLTPEGMKRYQEARAGEAAKVETAQATGAPVKVASLDPSQVGGGKVEEAATTPAKVGGYPLSLIKGGGGGVGLEASQASREGDPYAAGGKYSQFDAEGNRLPRRPLDSHPLSDNDADYREGGKYSRLGPNTFNMRQGGRFTQPNRGMLDRSALTSATTVRADGSVKVEVGDSSQAGTAAKEERLFASTPMQRQEAGQLTNIGPNAHESAKQYMAGVR